MSPHDAPTVREPLRETPSKSSAATNAWRMVSFILGLILAGGTVVSVAGKAFFVSRSEYTEKTQIDAVEHSQLHTSVDSIKTSLRDQELAFKDMTETVNNLRIEMVKNVHQRVQ